MTAERGGGRKRSPIARHALGAALAAVCLYLAFRGTDWGELRAVLRSASVPLILLAGGLSVLSNAIKCTKLGVLLRAVQRLRYRNLFAGEMISILVDVAFPFRLQEVVKATVIGRTEGIGVGFTLGAEVVEKAVEALGLVLLLLGLGLCFPLAPALAAGVLGAGLCLLAGVGVFLLLVVHRVDLVERLLRRVERWSFPPLARVRRLLANVVGGMRQAAVRPAALGQVLLRTAAEWSVLAATLWVAARAVGVTLNAPQVIGMLAANMAAFAVPSSTSGSIGIYEFAGTMTLVHLFAMPHEQALGLVLVFHFVMVAFGAAGGVVGLHLVRLGLRDVRRDAERA